MIATVMEQGWEEAGKPVGHSPFALVNAHYSSSVIRAHKGAVRSHSNADDTMPVVWHCHPHLRCL